MGVVSIGVVPMGVLTIGAVGMGLINLCVVGMGVLVAGVNVMGMNLVGRRGRHGTEAIGWASSHAPPWRRPSPRFGRGQWAKNLYAYPSKVEALRQAKAFGCKGVHAMGSLWMTCAEQPLSPPVAPKGPTTTP
jgi:hypothetical protein